MCWCAWVNKEIYVIFCLFQSFLHNVSVIFSRKFTSFCHFPSFSMKTCLANPDAWIQHLLRLDWALEQCSLSTFRKRDLGARRRMVRQDQWSDQVWSLPSQLVGTIPGCDVTPPLQLKRMSCLLMRVKKKYGWKSEQLGYLSKQCVQQCVKIYLISVVVIGSVKIQSQLWVYYVHYDIETQKT